jgi:CRISPR-associated endonuclease/helicase Cas3
MESLQLKSQDTTVNNIRSEILTACRKKAIGQTGIYTMTVPTGGGKTLSSLAFALEHAAKHNKQRIIYVIPYTSIIEQTANIFRDIFKPFDEVLIEHHSNTEPDKEGNENSWSRLATENWDAPLIVTTTVQLFESLYAYRTSRCRKLHNLVNSVIVLDEVQLLPPEQLNPIRHIIQSLNQYYGVTFVMTTATPTGFKEQTSPFGKKLLQGISSEEIIDSPANYYDQLNRVRYRLPDNFSHSQSWDEIAEELIDHESVLAVVNTRKDAKELWERMPKGSYHLSALMCAEHRSQIIKEIRERLKPGHNEPTKVISTQLVEAGVDFDFPVVYRALAGLDSIVQAAGRCNREGKLDKGEVVVFVPPTDPPKGILSTATHTAVSILTGFTGDIQAPDTFQRYFEQFFASVREHDKYGVLNKLQQTAREGQIQFRTAAQRFKMIDDKDTVPVFVRYREGDTLINILSKGQPYRELLRKLQRFTVTIYRYQFEAMLNRGDIQEICKGFYAQSGSGVYSDDLGLMVEQPALTPINSVI